MMNLGWHFSDVREEIKLVYHVTGHRDLVYQDFATLNRFWRRLMISLHLTTSCHGTVYIPDDLILS
jgi:hypothetical protein